MPSEAIDDLLLAVGEAVTNAVVHGGVRLPPAAAMPDTVMVELMTRGDHVVIAVTNPAPRWHVPAAELPADPAAPGGRGLFLMRHFTDVLRIEQSRRGTTVYLIRRVRPDRLDATPRRRRAATSHGHQRAG